jgi:hypothetical protein
MRTSDVSPLAKAQVEFVLLRSSVPAGRVQLILRSGLTRCPEPPPPDQWKSALRRQGHKRGHIGLLQRFPMLFLCLFVTLYTFDSNNVNRLHTVEVAGSNPAAPTRNNSQFELYGRLPEGACVL